MPGLSDDDLRELANLKEILEKGTFYDLFGVGREFERAELRTSYYAISRRFHPDRYYRQDLQGQEELLEQVFAGINLAYRTLDDPDERRKYSAEIGVRAPKLKAPVPPKKKKADASMLGRKRRAQAVEPVGDEVDTHTVDVDFNLWGRRHEGGPSDEEPIAPSKPKAKKKKKKSRAPPAVAALKKQLAARLRKARRHYESGLAQIDDGKWVQAASSLYLACQFDPRNADYKREYERANTKARAAQAAQYIQLAKNAEDYGSHREAVVYYQKATDLNPPDGMAYFRLGQLLWKLDPEDRAALDHLRTAVTKDGGCVEYRLLLAEVYEQHQMRLNAYREYKAANQLEPGNDTAKAGLRRTR
ncbi:MAG: J domain-containing protein [Proteobacteria bacterium]|nr:J domain-containing protein [Pseudomonadota bacterium]MCP4916057.1 J domain-containing protein [Pseudomonadota bacterium]